MNFPKHDNGKKDNRYTCNLEYCGYSIPLHVSRFCGDMIGASHTPQTAENVMQKHKEERIAS